MKIVYQTEDERYRVDRSRRRLVSGGIEITEWFPSRRFASEGVAIDHACQITEETGYAARVIDTRPEKGERRMNADDIELILTSGGCPEQYDATYNGETIGYLRLRHGHFTVEKDGPFGELLYEHSFSDSFKGMFDPDEREKFLNTAKQHLAHRLNKEGE